MAILTKAQLEALNQQSFPDQSTEAITPAILRTYNTATIDTLVDSLDTGSFTTDAEFNAFTSSTNSSITQLNSATASIQSQLATIGTQSGSWGAGGTSQVTSASFNAYTASTDSSISQLNASSASQQISINALNTNSSSVNSSITQLNASSASQQISINALNAATSSYATSAITASSIVDIFSTIVDNQFTYTKGDGSQQTVTLNASGGGTVPAGTISGSAQITSLGFVSSSVTASSLVTASFSGNTLTFTKGDSSTFGVVIPDVSGSTINTGSFATTGSNVFTGEQTLIDEAGNTVTISDISGSLVLIGKGTSSGSAGLSNISASANLLNIILKVGPAATGSLTISGSGNIMTYPGGPTAGFKRYIGGNNNIAFATPQITASLNYSPSTANNYLNGAIVFRGAVSSSAWGINNNIVNGAFNIGSADATSANQAIAGGAMSANIIFGGFNYNAYTTPLSASANFNNNLVIAATTLTAFSSSIQANNNIFNGNSFAVNNSYFGTASTNAAQRLALSYNVFGGINSSGLTTSGSNTTTSHAREVIGNTTNGSGISLGAVLNGDSSHLYSTLVHGSNLTVTGSSLNNTYANAGGAFIGRNNSVNGNAARSAETIFAVGTGTSTSNRKTGFLIDSGSNTFVEGTLNVSGSTSFNGAVNITGSLTSSLTQGYVWVGDGNNVTTLVATSSFGGGVTAPAGTVSSSAQIVAYNKFATTGSNTFTALQTNKSSLKFEEATGGSDNNINLASLNQATLYIQNTSVSSGYNSGSVLQLTTVTGSTGYGSGSTVFQMDALYEGNRASMKVGSTPGIGSYVQGFGDNILFAKQTGFPNTPSTTFRVDANSIELSGSIKVNTGSSGSAGIVSVGTGGTTVTNGLVTGGSIILATAQQLGGSTVYAVTVLNKTTGQFDLQHAYGGNLNVAYLIINPL